MKILQVCSASELGGGEVHVAGLVRALAARGHAVYLAVRPDSPLRQPLAGVIASWHEMPLRNSLDLQSVRAIADVVNEHRIDIVHAHMGRDYLVAALACKNTRARLVLTRHHYFPMKGNALYRWLLSDTAALIAVSEAVRESIIERTRLPAERVHCIPNWIDPEMFQPLDRDVARGLFQFRGALVVACIGQITPAKGQEEFIRAAGRVTHRRPDVEFVIAGEEQCEGKPFSKELSALAAATGARERIRFLGYVRHIPELLAAVDIVVVPSWDEGFSLVTIEALAARRAVLGSNIGGIAEILKDNVSGMLFAVRDWQQLAEKLLYLISDAPLRERLGVAGQRDVYQRFGRDQIIDRIESLYLSVLKSG